MSGSPHGVLGWTQPFGVSMKWLASLGGPRIDWPCAVSTKIAGARAPSSAMRIVRMIRCIVTPKNNAVNSHHGGRGGHGGKIPLVPGFNLRVLRVLRGG